MTKNEKRRFINALVGSVRKSLLARLDDTPETWDGIELRRWIADTFRAQSFVAMSIKRNREYRNDVLIRNL